MILNEQGMAFLMHCDKEWALQLKGRKRRTALLFIWKVSSSCTYKLYPHYYRRWIIYVIFTYFIITLIFNKILVRNRDIYINNMG